MLQRTAIRKAIQSRLLGLTDAQGRVFTTRVRPWKVSQLPGIAIYTSSDPVDRDSRQTAARVYKRDLVVKIECAAIEAADMDDRLDALEEQVRPLLEVDLSLKDAQGAPRCRDMFLVSSELHVEEGGEQFVGVLTLTWEVTYDDEIATGDPDNLKTVDVHTSVADAQPTADQAEDTVSFAPVISSFTLPATSETLEVAILSLVASDDEGVTGYMLSESATMPSPDALGWSTSAPTSFTFASAGAKTLRAWVKDAAGNVAGSSATVTITEPPP
jgi:hypothetical protein